MYALRRCRLSRSLICAALFPIVAVSAYAQTPAPKPADMAKVWARAKATHRADPHCVAYYTFEKETFYEAGGVTKVKNLATVGQRPDALDAVIQGPGRFSPDGGRLPQKGGMGWDGRTKLVVADDPRLRPQGQGAIEFWVRPTKKRKGGGYCGLVENMKKVGDDYFGYGLTFCIYQNKPFWYAGDGKGKKVWRRFGATNSERKWTHWIITWRNADSRLDCYKDGKSVRTTGDRRAKKFNAVRYTDEKMPLTIGGAKTAARPSAIHPPAPGYLGALAIHDRFLDAKKVVKLYESNLPPPPRFDVRTFGAVGDGATNDAAAIQRAVNAAEATERAVVFFPRSAKPYLVGKTIRVQHGKAKIEGDDATIQLAGDAIINVVTKRRKPKASAADVVTGGLRILAPALAEPKPLEKDDHTIFLAHFDGATAAGGLAADFSRGDPAPSSKGQCALSEKPEGRFGHALQLKDTGYASYELKDVNLESCTIEAWFRIDSKDMPWWKPGKTSYRYQIVNLSGYGKPYDSILIGFRYGGLAVIHRAQGKRTEKRLFKYGDGQWLRGSEHSIAVTVDGSGGDGKTVLRIYGDGKLVGEVKGLSPMRTKNYKLWLGKKLRKGRDHDRTLAGLLDEVRVSDVPREHVDFSRPQWRGFLPGPYERCRTNLPLQLYFSEPVDTRISTPVRLIDLTAGKKLLPCRGKYLGNGSLFEMKPASPLPFGHELVIEFERGENQVRDTSGNRLDLSAVPRQRFRTRAKGQAPRFLPLKFRNDNSHATIAGMERMCAGMDALEFNLVQIKDGWISNHLRKGKDKAGKRVRQVIPLRGGDDKGFKNIQTAPAETLYATYAAVDYDDTSDGKIDPLPRAEDVYAVIKKWDKMVHLQVSARGENPKTAVEAFLKKVRFDWSRLHAWHGRCGGALPNGRRSRFALAYPYRGYRPRGRADDPGSPGFTNPEWVRRAKQNGRTVWHYTGCSEKSVRSAARLGMEFFMNNSLAYRGDPLARKVLYKLHQHEGAGKPVVQSVTRTDKGGPKPVIAVRFDQSIESRSFNYSSVRMTRRRDRSGKRFPLRIERDAEWQTFTITPQHPLSKGVYQLEIGDGKGPVSVAGMPLAKKGQLTVTVK